METKGIGIRAAAQIIDLIIGGIIFFLVGSLYTGSIGFELTGGPALTVIGVTILIIFLYFFILEANGGQTLGKMITGIKVVNENGRPCDLSSSFARNILRLIDGIVVYLVGAILVARSDENQRLGDRVAGTVVIEA